MQTTVKGQQKMERFAENLGKGMQANYTVVMCAGQIEGAPVGHGMVMSVSWGRHGRPPRDVTQAILADTLISHLEPGGSMQIPTESGIVTVQRIGEEDPN